MQVETTGQTARGEWVMLQASTFANGASRLNAAKLVIDFLPENERWVMCHFQRENLLSRPVSAWNSEATLPMPSR